MATSVAEPPLTVAELFTELMVFPVTYVPTTDTVFELSLFPEASVTATSAISELSLSIEAPFATTAEPPEVVLSAAKHLEVAGVFTSAPFGTGAGAQMALGTGGT